MHVKLMDFVDLRRFGCVRASKRRCEIVAGAGNPLSCGCVLAASVSQNAVGGFEQ